MTYKNKVYSINYAIYTQLPNYIIYYSYLYFELVLFDASFNEEIFIKRLDVLWYFFEFSAMTIKTIHGTGHNTQNILQLHVYSYQRSVQVL